MVPQQLAEFLQVQRPQLRAFLSKRLDRGEDVDDAVQETCLRVLRYHASTQVQSPAALLYHVAENVANDQLRRSRSHHAHAHDSLADMEWQLPPDERNPERATAVGQQLARVAAAVEQLPPRCRQVFLLSRMHGMSYPEIARHCGISVKMVEKQISRALQDLRRQVGAYPGAAPT